MKVVELKTADGRTRYYLADATGAPVKPVFKYLKFKDNAGYAKNTLRMHCIHMKHFFTFLEEIGKDYKSIGIDDIARFIGWLKNPDVGKRIVTLRFKPLHKEQTINANIDTVIAFYDYLMRRGGLDNNLSEKLVKFIQNPNRAYRRFLHGIASNKQQKSHILKLNVPQRIIKTISKKDATLLLNATTNIRDYFLLFLLFETGMRIGEALSLWLEDFDISGLKIIIRDRGELENAAEIKTVSSPRKLDCTIELMNVFSEFVCLFHDTAVETNHVFIKLWGKRSGKAMDYRDVDNLFRTLRKKTGIYITAHMFRHTSLSLLHKAGWEAEHLKERAGHKNIYTTLNTYVHPTEEDILEAFEKASENLKVPDAGKGGAK